MNLVLDTIILLISCSLFYSLLLRRECCSFSNGEYVKAGLAELDRWISEASEKVIESHYKKKITYAFKRISTQ